MNSEHSDYAISMTLQIKQ